MTLFERCNQCVHSGVSGYYLKCLHVDRQIYMEIIKIHKSPCWKNDIYICFAILYLLLQLKEIL